MTVDEALAAMAAIDGQLDGTDERAELLVLLYRKLLECPEEFWDFFFESLNAAHQCHFRELAERLTREGRTSFADARTALDEYSAVGE